MNILNRVLDERLSPHDRGNLLIEAVNLGAIDFGTVVSLIESPEPYVRSSCAKALVKFSDNREIYRHLVKMLKDPEIHVRGDAILAMGESGDSRFTFLLFNYYPVALYEEQKRILLAFDSLKDPRAKCFLKKFIKEDSDIGSLARTAYNSCSSNTLFSYTFAGREDLLEYSRSREGRILVKSSSNLDENLGILEEHGWERPQTYVIDLDNNLFIGGLLDEHVDVARGKKVLAAGEINFFWIKNEWHVEYANNRSNGYYPDSSSFLHLKNALIEARIKYPDNKFTEVFPKYEHGYCDNEFLQFQPFYL